MNLTRENVKEIISKVHKDLQLPHDDKYPVLFTFTENGHNFGPNIWGGGYDYNQPELVGDDETGLYPEYIVFISDDTGEAIKYGYYTGWFNIALGDDGKYKVLDRF